MEELSNSAIIFKNHFVPISSCSASRASLITGRWPHSHGMPELIQKNVNWDFVNSLDLFPKILKESGYCTVHRGKWHIGATHWSRPSGFALEAFDSAKGGDPKMGGEESWIEALKKRPKNKPFFAWFAAHDAHRNWSATEGAYAIKEPQSPAKVKIPSFIPDVKVNGYDTRQDFASYYDEIKRFDNYLGDVIQELKDQKIYENTVILITSDNGRPFARSKVYCYDSGTKVPLLISDPRQFKKKKIYSPVVSSIDLAPTILEYAQIVPGKTTFQGKSLHPAFADSEEELHKYVYGERNWHIWKAHERYVRSDKFLYIKNNLPELQARGADWKSDEVVWHAKASGDLKAEHQYFFSEGRAEELYDVEKDPQQINNLAGNIEYKATLERLRSELNRWSDETGDTVPGKLTEDWMDRSKKGYPKIIDFKLLEGGTPPGSK